MAIENNDLFVLQKRSNGELRKATVAALLADVVTPVLPDVPEKLADLDDVSNDIPTDDQFLKWDGSQWAPADVVIPVLPDVPEELADLNDVSDDIPADGQVLKWDGSQWAPADDEIRDLTNYLQKPGEEGEFIIVEANDGTITYSSAIDCGEYAV